GSPGPGEQGLRPFGRWVHTPASPSSPRRSAPGVSGALRGGELVLSPSLLAGSLVGATPCWQVEEFVVMGECAQCVSFQMKTMPECSATGFVEQINCSSSKKDSPPEYKSCRSAVMETRIFWKFEGSMLGLAVLFALLVLCRQRMLDRRALEKVRKQIESI
uniref:Protein JTB n=1 Tax=Sphenodon punctatus TaxID=8508 RepID=A0A8D0L3B6_SPHPU